MTSGTEIAAFFYRASGGGAGGHHHVEVQGDQFGNQRGKPLVFSFGPSVLDRDIAALLIAEVAQALPKWLYEVGLESRRGVS